MTSALIRAMAVLLFFALLAFHVATGAWTDQFGEPLLRALRAIDWIITTFVTTPFGPLGGGLALCGLGIVLAWAAYRRRLAE